MHDALLTLGLLAVLALGFAAGRLVHRSLAERHRGPETMDFVRGTASLLITLTAIVLGLLLTAVDGSFSRTADDLRKYSATIILLDRDLDAIGAPMAPARAALRRYVASTVADNWPGEAPPSGSYAVAQGRGIEVANAILGGLLYDVQAELRAYAPPDAIAARVQAAALADMSAVLAERWTLIGEAHSSITPQFLAMVTVWLALLFVAFGLTAPRNRVGVAASAAAAISVAAALYLALELDGPLDGLVTVPSEPMRQALSHIDRVAAPPPPEASLAPGAW